MVKFLKRKNKNLKITQGKEKLSIYFEKFKRIILNLIYIIQKSNTLSYKFQESKIPKSVNNYHLSKNMP